MTKRQASCSSSPKNLIITESESGSHVTCNVPQTDQQGGDDCRTGLVYEYGNLHNDVHNRYHIERSTRIVAVQQHLWSRGIEQRCCKLLEVGGQITNDDNNELFLQSCDYLRVHLPGYMSRLEHLSKCSCQDRLDREAAQFQSIYFCPNTVQEAKQAAISLCIMVSKVVLGELDNGFAVIRPPGHHAEPGLAGGYCVINNVAVAAGYAKERLGCRKILIGTLAPFFPIRCIQLINLCCETELFSN